MGEAKRRGTRDARIEQSLQRRVMEGFNRKQAARDKAKKEEERIASLPEKDRIDLVMSKTINSSRQARLLLTGLAVAAAAGLLVSKT